MISWLPAAHIAERGAHYYLPVIRGRHASRSARTRARSASRWPPCGRPGSSPCRGSSRRSRPGSRPASPSSPTSSASRPRRASRPRSRRSASSRPARRSPRSSPPGVAQAEEAMFAPLRQKLGLDELVACNVGAAPTPGRGARVLPRDRDPDRRAVGDVRDLRRRHLQPARQGQDRHGRAAGPRRRDQAGRGRRGPGQGARRSCPATATCPRRTPRRSTTTAGC